MNSWSDGFMGQRGTQLHDAIVNWTRFELMSYIRTVFPDVEWSCIYDDGIQMFLLDTKGGPSTEYGGRGKNAKFPDGLWIYSAGNIVIEVGRYLVDKWHEDQQVLHIGFDGQVNVINPKDGFILDVADAIRDYRVEMLNSV